MGDKQFRVLIQFNFFSKQSNGLKSGLSERGASLTSKLPERSRRNQNCAQLAVIVSAP